jgi:hypothetical protein
MNTFLFVMLLWAGFVGIFIWPNMRGRGAAVRWLSILLVAGAYAVCFYVWKSQLWTSPAIWIMRFLEPIIPNN